MRQNALRVKWQRGYVEVTDSRAILADRRHEGFLSTNAASEDEARTLGQAALLTVAEERIAVSVKHEPISARPYVDYRPFDTLALPDWLGLTVEDKVLAVTVSEDETGNPIYEPEVSSIADTEHSFLAQLQSSIKGMANDGLKGRTRVAAPTSKPPAVDVTKFRQYIPPFTTDGPLAASESPRWYANTTRRIWQFMPALTTAGSSTTTVELRRNGSTIATVNIAAGDHQGFADLQDEYVVDGDYLTVAITAVGTGAGGLVATVGQ